MTEEGQQKEEQGKIQKNNLENKVILDRWELIPLAGLVEFGINIDTARNTAYTLGFGGQLVKHLKQQKEFNFTESIPIDTILYGILQVCASYGLYHLVK